MHDTHAHLNFPELSSRIEEIVKKSQAAEVKGVIIASSNLKDSLAAVELAKKYPGHLYASVGIHPQKTDPDNHLSIQDQLLELEKLIKQNNKYEYRNSKFENSKIISDLGFRASNLPPVVAIGETGLDFSEPPPGEEKRTKEEQEALFKGQIKLAQKYNLPLIVHAREAVDEVIEILRLFTVDCSLLTGVFHCYAGGRKRISKILNLPGQWYFGFDGNLTYDEGLQNIIKLIPEDRILIETDSPFLTPAPYRGETNTPAYLPLIQKKINQIFNRDLEKKIVENSLRLFPGLRNHRFNNLIGNDHYRNQYRRYT